jgi:hypothetical protein
VVALGASQNRKLWWAPAWGHIISTATSAWTSNSAVFQKISLLEQPQYITDEMQGASNQDLLQWIRCKHISIMSWK